MSEAIEDLQIRLSFQEETLNSLEQQLIAQDKVIRDMEQKMAVIVDYVKTLKQVPDSEESGVEPPPPHY